MANTSTVYARINPELKKDVELILNKLGITPSSLIQMLYSEIRLTRKIPLSLSIPSTELLSLDTMPTDEFNKEMQIGMDEIKKGNMHSLNELDKIIKKKCKK